MKEHPILFNSAMVRALLAGEKTQTRRVVKWPESYAPDESTMPGIIERRPHSLTERCPYGQPGDRLWVRETFYAWGRWQTRYSTKKGRDEWHFIDMTLESGRQYRFAADMGDNGPRERGGITPQWWKRPAIFMPRAAIRILLEVVSVRVERLQDISEADAQSEGARIFSEIRVGMPFARPNRWSMESPENTDQCFSSAKWAFAKYFCKVASKKPYDFTPWDANPWVWVVEFKRVTP